MNGIYYEIPKEAEEKFSQANHLMERAQKLMKEGNAIVTKKTRSFMRELEDKQLNRTQCLQYLSINTLESLKNWERKYSPYGYLRFTSDKIMRSDLLRFLDDLNSGKVHQKMKG